MEKKNICLFIEKLPWFKIVKNKINSKITVEVKYAIQKWVLYHIHIVESPNSRDSIKLVNNGDDRQYLVQKNISSVCQWYLLYIFLVWKGKQHFLGVVICYLIWHNIIRVVEQHKIICGF